MQDVASGTTVTFRLYGWGATNSLGTFAIGRLAGNDLSLGGTVTLAPCLGGTVTWDGTNWSPSNPDSSTKAIINADYDSSTDGNFSACSLTVNVTHRLTVGNSSYVEVENDVTVDGELFVDTQGNFVQNNDLGIVTNNGIMRVYKETAPMNAWYEYTYWSSPVSGAEFANAIDRSNPERRYIFNGKNFLDSYAEVNNNDDTTTPGQEDIDDNNNDWQWVSGNTIMEPGVGYATT